MLMGAINLQGFKSRMMIQIQHEYDPLIINIVHCMIHQTNLTDKPFQTYPWFFALNSFTMFVWYFSHSPKKRLEFTKLVKIWRQKGNKNSHNIKIVRWIFMVNPIKCVLSKYHIFFMKMALDVAQTLYLILFFFFH
jgi:hypothetical protein